MSKHTPGEWGVCQADDLTAVTIVCPAGEVCYLDGYDSSEREEQLANARLIAAAPDLVTGCHAAAALCQRFNSNSEEIDILPEEIDDVLQLLLAAITKARGEVE